jgi:hypothetical protein
MNKETTIKAGETPTREELLTALWNVRRSLLDGNWSVALGHTENALGLVGVRKAA